MQTQNPRAEPHTSSDPIAAVRLWPLLALVFAAGTIVAVVLPPSPSQDLRDKAYGVAVFAAIVVWWLDCVAGATRRAGFQPSSPSAGAVVVLASKVAVGVMMAKLVWLLLAEHALGLPRIGLVTAPTLMASEPTAPSIAFVVFLVSFLGPAAEEMLFRGTLFRKWRLRLGPGKAALLTSVLFGLGHAVAPGAFLTALSMAVLYTTTRTIWAPVAAHAMNNLFAVTLRHSRPVLPQAVLEAASDWRLQLAFLVPGLLGTWWLARFLWRGWHTLADPVHGVRLDTGAGSHDISEHEPHPRAAARPS